MDTKNIITNIVHIGEKYGMDYYPSSLAKGFVNQKYSNFIGIEERKINYKKYYYGYKRSNIFVKLFQLLIAAIKSFYDVRKQKNDLLKLYHNYITKLEKLIDRDLSMWYKEKGNA